MSRRSTIARLGFAAALLLAVRCDRGEAPVRDAAGNSNPSANPSAAASAPANAAADAPTSAPAGAPTGATAAPAGEVLAPFGPTVVFLGDSLTAGYGIDVHEAYPALVERHFDQAGTPIRAVNAGVSGDTSAGGLERLDWLLAQRPAIVFVCLGGNDGLRGLPLEATERNLRTIVEKSLAAGAKVVLAGMQIPPNYGPEYVAGFRALFPRLAAEYDLPFVPFLLEGVATRAELNLRDGIHPNAEGQKIVARTVANALEPLVRDLADPTR